MIKYTVNNKTVSIEEFNNVEVYGITVCENEEIILDVEDISPDRNFVENIIHKLVEYDVAFCHIMDVIEDEMP